MTSKINFFSRPLSFNEFRKGPKFLVLWFPLIILCICVIPFLYYLKSKVFQQVTLLSFLERFIFLLLGEKTRFSAPTDDIALPHGESPRGDHSLKATFLSFSPLEDKKERYEWTCQASLWKAVMKILRGKMKPGRDFVWLGTVKWSFRWFFLEGERKRLSLSHWDRPKAKYIFPLACFISNFPPKIFGYIILLYNRQRI